MTPSLVITDHDAAAAVLQHDSGVDAAGHVVRGPFTHVLSIVGTWTRPDADEVPPPGGQAVWAAYRAEKLLLTFDDVTRQSVHGDPPREAHVQAIVSLARRLTPQDRVLVHCGAGISRSTAAALVILAHHLGPDREAQAVEHLLALRPQARPHQRMVEMADALLDRQGALYSVVSERLGHLW